jgi:hypothetical protein
MTELLSAPKAHMHCGPPGTWNLQKLQLELKYLGKKVADARLKEVRFTVTQKFTFESESHFAVVTAISQSQAYLPQIC